MTEVVTDQTPPLLQGPSDKEKKYDRQLRLWAASGQQALEDAHILLMNSGSGSAGVETLKNLVLPGIGNFTIADDAIVTERDLGVNFFLDEDSLGRSRAESCVKLLLELNPDVKGNWYPQTKDDSLEKLLQSEQNYTLVLYSLPIEPERLAFIQSYGKERKVPLIAINSVGFYSYFHIQLPGSFPIVDTHPDSTATTDLRLLTPWPELSAFAAELTKDIENLPPLEHGHIPYVVLLLHYLEEWKKSNGTPPSSYKDKKEFQKFVAGKARTDNAEGGEENYEEAAAAVLKTISVPEISSSVREVFDYTPSDIEAKSDFWIIAAAIKKFYTEHKQLPLPGSVPDMKAQSNVYVQLQNVYKSKARQDVAEVLNSVRDNPIGADVGVAQVESFCKNAAFIKLIHATNTTPTDLKALADKEKESDDNASFTMMPLSLFPIYLALDATAHVPGASQSEIIATISEVIPDASTSERIVEIAEEVARAKGGELHNISALTGGMVSQEVIKIITKQYIPVDNLCIFDGVTSRTQVVRL